MYVLSAERARARRHAGGHGPGDSDCRATGEEEESAVIDKLYRLRLCGWREQGFDMSARTGATWVGWTMRVGDRCMVCRKEHPLGADGTRQQ